MTKPMPTVAELMKAHIKGESNARIAWNEGKKKVQKTIDPKVFTGDLGPKLDTLAGLCQGAIEVKRFYAKLDDRTHGPVKKQHAAVNKTIGEYRFIITKQIKNPAVTADQRKAWELLESRLTIVEANVGAWLKKAA